MIFPKGEEERRCCACWEMGMKNRLRNQLDLEPNIIRTALSEFTCFRLISETHALTSKNVRKKLKGTVQQDFRLFHESIFPKPLSIPLGPFQILLKILGDICSSRYATSVVGGKRKKSSSEMLTYS